MTISKIIAFLLCLSITLSAYADEGFPGREKYPDIPYITLSDFYHGYVRNNYVIVDARSNFEFNVIQIKGAINLPVNSKNFYSDINKLAQTTNKTIVFYCNGRRCMKSFKAAAKSKLSNIFVFDAGIFEWAKEHPEESALMGESPLPLDKLISSSKLKEHFISLSQFEQLIPESVLIDVRDLKERRGSGLFLLADRSAPLSNQKKLERYVNKAIKEGKTFLAYDNAGKQVRWLQYYLEQKGIKKYYFMGGGAKYYTYQ